MNFHLLFFWRDLYSTQSPGPAIVRRSIRSNPGLNVNLSLGRFSFVSKAFSPIIFSFLFRAASQKIKSKGNSTEFAL